METNIIEIVSAKIWLGEDGICRIEHFPAEEVTLEEMKEVVAAQSRLVKKKKTPVLIDANLVKGVAAGARKYLSGEAAAGVSSACALVMGSVVGRIIGNFFIRFNKPPYPCRLFTSKTEALEWLKTFLEKQKRR